MRLLATTDARLILIDNLSSGQHPRHWLPIPCVFEDRLLAIFGGDRRILFIKSNAISLLGRCSKEPKLLDRICSESIGRLDDVFHFAAVVGGRNKIDNDPLAVATNLAIDAQFFNWACRHRPSRILYPSSSAVYPAYLQNKLGAPLLKEELLDFRQFHLPDETYGWAKLSGELLAQKAASTYGLHICCVRPFSGYGEGQDASYPVTALALRAIGRQNPLEVWGSGFQERDFVHIDDLLSGMLLALDHIADGTAINLASGRRNSFIDVINILTTLAGYTPQIKPRIEKPTGVLSRCGDPKLAERILGWKASIKLAEGLERMYKALSKMDHHQARTHP